MSVFLPTGRATLGAERRVPAGSRPTGVAAINPYPSAPHYEDLAVTDAGANMVRVLRNDGRGDFESREEVHVGKEPVALVPDGFVPLLVVDRGAGALSVVPVTPKSAGPASTVAVPGAAPHGLALIAPGDVIQQLAGVAAVVDPERGRATMVTWSGRGFRAGGSFPVAGRPAAAVMFDVGGNRALDLVTADPGRGVVSVAITPDDRQLDSDRTDADVTAGAGYVIWSHVRSDQRYGLAAWHAGTVREIGAGGWRVPRIVRIGRGRRGQPVVSYGRCDGHGCRAYVYDLRRRTEQRLAMRVPTRCLVKSVEQWRRAVDYWLRSRPGSNCRRAGGWVSFAGRRPRRVGSASIHFLGDVRPTRVGWMGVERVRRGYRLRTLIRGRAHRRRVLVRSAVCGDACPGIGGKGPMFDGRDTYTLVNYRHTILLRSRAAHGLRCTAEWGQGDIGTSGIPSSHVAGDTGDVAVADGRIYYADGRGVFAVDPARVRWRTRGCTARR